MVKDKMILSNSKKGFSLIELAVVIVIIGLIIASVLLGQNLINKSKMRSVMADIRKIQVASNEYKMKYYALPGDHGTAYNYFGASCDATASKCNGNNDKRVDLSGVADDNEVIRFWQHLNLSGMLPGNYTGVSVAGGDGNVTQGNVNVMASKYGKSTSYYVLGIFTSGAWTSQTVKYGNVVIWGQDQAASSSNIAFLPVNDAYNLDTKFDDGKPYLGNILSLHNAACNTGSGASGVYQIGTSNNCAMGFYLE